MNVNSLIVNVNSGDPDRLTSFYRETVQLPPQEGMGPGAFQLGGENAVFIIDGHSEVSGKAKEPPRVLINFMVDSAADETARLEAAGVPVVRRLGVQDWGGIISTFTDPDGNYFQVMQFDPAARRRPVRRADRLFQVIQLLRRKRVATAATLARELEVSERTIYRDIRDLVLSGVPIEGEAGVGYMLRKGFDLPPLMFTEQEIEALVLGVRVVKSWGDAQLGRAASDALARVEAALPERLRTRLENTPLFAPGFRVSQTTMGTLSTFRAAIDERRKVRIAYTDPKESSTERAVRPLGLFFWGATWSVDGLVRTARRLPHVPAWTASRRRSRSMTASNRTGRRSLDAFFDMMRNEHGMEMRSRVSGKWKVESGKRPVRLRCVTPDTALSEGPPRAPGSCQAGVSSAAATVTSLLG